MTNGKVHDLSALSADFSTPQEIELRAQEQDLSIWIEGKEVYRQKYEDAMGTFVGLRFKFEGIGEVLNFQILDQNGEEVVLP